MRCFFSAAITLAKESSTKVRAETSSGVKARESAWYPKVLEATETAWKLPPKSMGVPLRAPWTSVLEGVLPSI